MNDVFLTTARLRAIAHWKIQNHINELEMNIDPNWNNGIGFDKNYLTQSKLVFFWERIQLQITRQTLHFCKSTNNRPV